MLKKTISILLVVVLVLALCGTAMAAGKDAKSEKAPVVYYFKWVDLNSGASFGPIGPTSVYYGWQEHLRSYSHTQYGTTSNPYIYVYYGYGLKNTPWINVPVGPDIPDRQANSNWYTWVDMRTGRTVSVDDGAYHEWDEHLDKLDHYKFGDDPSVGSTYYDGDAYHKYYFGYNYGIAVAQTIAVK